MIGIPGMARRSVLGGLLLAMIGFAGAGSVAAAPIPADGLGQEALKLPPGAFRRLGDVRMRFGNTLFGMVAIPGGNTIATATEKGISIWDPASGFELATAPLPKLGSGQEPLNYLVGGSRSLIASRDGKCLILLTGNRLWRYALPLKGAPEPWVPEMPNGRLPLNVMLLQHLLIEPSEDTVYGVTSFGLTSGKFLFEWKRGEVNWKRTREFQGFQKFGKLATGGDYIATTADDGRIQIFDMRAKASLRTITLAEPVRSMVFSEDGKFLAAQTAFALQPVKQAKPVKPAIHVWNVPENREVALLDGFSSKMALSHDGKHLAYWDLYGSLDLIDLQTTKKIQSITGRRLDSSALHFTADDQFLFEASTRLIRTWDLKAGRVLHENLGHAGTVNAIVAFGNDGWISAGEDGAIIQWDGTGREVRRFLGSRGPVQALVLSPDGATLYAAARYASVHAWDVATGKELRTYESDGVTCLALTPDSRFLVIGGRENVSLLDAASFKLERPPVPINRGESVRGVACPSNEQGFDYSRSTAIRSWDLKTGAELFCIDTNFELFQDTRIYASPFVVTRDCQRIIAPIVTSKKIAYALRHNFLGIWDGKTGRLLDTVESPLPILTIAAHPNGKECALGHSDGTIGLLDLEKKTVRKLFDGHRGGVLKLTYSRDGKTLASSSTDTTILLWKLDAKD